LLVLAIVTCTSAAHAGAREPELSDTWTSVQWKPQPVRYPVVPAQVQPDAPHVPEDVPTVAGTIEIGPERASVLWLDALDVLRVRSVDAGASSQGATTSADGEPVVPARIIFRRVIGAVPDAAARARGELEEEPVATAPGLWYVAQPPARGDVWLISASAPMHVVIERPVWRDDARLWEQSRTAVLQWIEHGGVMPELPAGPDSAALGLGLRADHALAQILVQRRPTAPRFHQAVRDWRSAAALTRLATVGARRQPYHWSEERTAALAAATPGSTRLTLGREIRPYARVDGDELVWLPTFQGPGVVEIELRALLPTPSSSEDAMGLVRVGANGRILTEHRYQRRPAYVQAEEQPPDAPFPQDVQLRTADGIAAGLRERIRVPLLPGEHTYALTLRGGPSLVRVRILRRRPRLFEALRGRANPGDFIAAAEVGLAGDDAPEAALLALLLGEMRGSPARASGPPAGLSPLLALVAEIVRHRGRELEPGKPDAQVAPDALRALVAQAGPMLMHAGPDIDPALLWLLRRDLAELAAQAGAPVADVLVALTRDADALPPVITARVAELVALTPIDHASAEAHAWALAAAQRAWRAAPLDPAIRRAYGQVWRTAAAWSRLAGMRAGTGGDATLAGVPELPGHRFIERISDGSDSPGGSATPHDPSTLWPSTLWPIALGQRQRVVAPSSSVDHRRPMVLRAYVAMPSQVAGSIQLRVDGRAFSALALAPVQLLEVAVSPGAHEVVVYAPAGAEAFLSLAPDAATGQRARIRVLRPAWERDQATRYLVPAWYRGLPVRVTLQVTVPETASRAEPVLVLLRTDTGQTRTMAVAVDATDASRIPVDSAAPVSAAVRTVLWLPSDAQSFWLEPVQPGAVSQIWASVSLRQPAPDSLEPLVAGAPAPGRPGDAAQPPTGVTGTAERTTARTWTPGEPEWTGHLNEIAELSRALVTAPDEITPRLRRALRLLDIAELGHARMDWSRLTAVPPERLTADERVASAELAQRMDDWRDPRYLPPQSLPQDSVVALTPAAMTLASDRAQLEEWLPAALAARRGDRTLLHATAQERDTPLARYYQAELLRSQGAHAEAARMLRALHEETGALAIGIEALHAFEAALTERQAAEPARAAGPDQPAADLASLAYGLALTMRERFAHPVIQRVLLAAAERSRWEPLRGTEASAGFESLRVDEELLDPEPDALLERALLAPPWPQEQARVVRPGRGALLALELRAPARIQPQAWCQRIRGELTDATCTVRWRVDGGPEQTREVPFAQATTLGPIALSRGRHEVEVVLDDRDHTVRLAVRFAANRAIARETTPDGAAIPILRPGRMHVADAQHPVEATVLGPTTIRVEARRYMDEPPVTLAVEARPERAVEPAAPITRQVRVDASQDPSASGDESRAVRLSQASTTVLVLPAPGVYRLVLRPQGGRALVRLWHRRDVAAAPLELEPAPETAASLPDTDAPPASGMTVTPGAFASGNALGGALWRPAGLSPWPTLSVGLSFRRDELAERDLEDEPLGNRFQLDVAWRRQLVPERFWLRVESALRWHPGSQPAYGTSLDLVWRRLPLGLRVDVMGRAYAQSAGDSFAWTAHSRLRAGRLFRLQPSLTLLPALAVQARSYSLAPGAGVVLDPLVYNQYDVTHRSGLRPEATLLWQPFQDQLGLVRARYVTNEDFYSADRAEIELAWRGVGAWPRTDIPLFELHYRPGLRFDDEHRSRSYVRHDLGLRLDWSLWNGKSGRWLLEVRDEVYLSSVVGNRNVFLLGIRYDAVDGRGLRDMLPIEYRFDDLIEPPPWAD
jgi:hypothetical protein